MINTISLASRALRHLPLALRLADRFAARHGRSKLKTRWLALRGLVRAVRAQHAHPELPLPGLFVHSYVQGDLNASLRNHS